MTHDHAPGSGVHARTPGIEGALMAMGHPPAAVIALAAEGLRKGLGMALLDSCDATQVAGRISRFAKAEDRVRKTRKRLGEAAVYPLALLGAGSAVAAVGLTQALPPLLRALNTFGTDVPKATLALLRTFEVIKTVGPKAFWVVVLVLGLTHRYRKRRRINAKGVLSYVVRLERLSADSLFCFLASDCLEDDIHCLAAFELAQKSTSQMAGASQRATFCRLLRSGLPPTHAVPVLGDSLGRMLADAGTQPAAGLRLQNAATMLEERATTLLERCLSVAGPLMVLMVSGLLGIVAICMLLPVLAPAMEF